MKILSVKDSSAEPAGFFFAPDGKTAYVNIQHSNDSNMPLLDDHGTDGLIKITGFKVRRTEISGENRQQGSRGRREATLFLLFVLIGELLLEPLIVRTPRCFRNFLWVLESVLLAKTGRSMQIEKADFETLRFSTSSTTRVTRCERA